MNDTTPVKSVSEIAQRTHASAAASPAHLTIRNHSISDIIKLAKKPFDNPPESTPEIQFEARRALGLLQSYLQNAGQFYLEGKTNQDTLLLIGKFGLIWAKHLSSLLDVLYHDLEKIMEPYSNDPRCERLIAELSERLSSTGVGALQSALIDPTGALTFRCELESAEKVFDKAAHVEKIIEP